MARPSDDERASLLHRGPDDEIRTSEGDYSPEIVTKVVTRVKALIHDFLPVPVEAGKPLRPFPARLGEDLAGRQLLLERAEFQVTEFQRRFDPYR